MYVPRLGLWLALLFAALGGGAGTWLLLMPLPMQPGDVVSFAGAIIGSALTVLGALLVLEWQDSRRRNRERNLLDALLGEVLDAVELVKSPEGDDRLTAAQMQGVALAGLRRTVDQVRAARQWITPDSAGAVRAYQLIETMKVNDSAIEQVRADAGKEVANLAPQLRSTELIAAAARKALREDS